jgi:type IV pilus assembly protein PilV
MLKPPGRSSMRGSTLVEVLVSVLLFAIGIAGLLRLLGTAVKDAGEIEFRSQAVAIADERIGRIWADLDNIGDYAEADVAVPELPNGTRTVAIAGNVVTVTVGWQLPGADARNHVVVATLATN